MKIAVLGWGSLIWDKRELGIDGKWFADGPCLPIEFARKSSEMRVTLVLIPKYEHLSRSYWANSAFETLDAACENLRARENCDDLRPIHVVESAGGRSFGGASEPHEDLVKPINEFRQSRKLDAVVWTGLKPKSFSVESSRLPLADQVLGFLRSLSPDEEAGAKEYVRKAPAAIDTPVRRAIRAELKWTDLPLSPDLFHNGLAVGPACSDSESVTKQR
jgi:hypothetical protein